MKEDKTFELWLDGESNLAPENGSVYLWSGGSSKENFYSVLDYVEANSSGLRAKYLAFIHDLGGYETNGKPIVEHLSDHRGYNLWWMSKLAEKSHLNSPQLTDCIKLLALEEILLNEKPQSIVVYSDKGNKELLLSINSLCTNLGIEFSYRLAHVGKKRSFWESIRRTRPEILTVVFWLFRYVRKHWKLRNKRRVKWFEDQGSITMFSYFYSLDVKKCSNGEFYSNQWGILPEILRENGMKLNWIHHFMKFHGMNNAETALSWVEGFNNNSEQQGNHCFFESYLSFGLIFLVAKNYIKYFFKSFFLLSKAHNAFRLKGSAVYLWPMLKSEWIASVRGGAAIRNIMFIELVDGALKNIPRQKLGLYLQENQFWERALIHAWRRYGHGKLIGVPHATVNFWDLRYFDDIKTINRKSKFPQPLPDLVALHGPVAKMHFINAGYPLSKIVEVEALRYLSLGVKKHNEHSRRSPSLEDQINVIILGELKLDFTMEMLHSIEDATSQNGKMSFTFKPHPACIIDINNINIPDISVTREPLDQILHKFDIAIVAGSTSAAVDVYYSGVSLIVYLGKKELNLNPLREFENVVFVRTASDFKTALLRYNVESSNVNNSEFFWVDKELPRWLELVGRFDSSPATSID